MKKSSAAVAGCLLAAVVGASDQAPRQASDIELYAELARRSAANSANKGKAKSASPAPSLTASPFDSLIAELRFREKVVYGVDDRLEVYAVMDKDILDGIRGTAALIRGQNLKQGPNGWTITAATLAQANSVCPSEKFATQVTAAFCSGFLMRADRLVTAGHCVKSQADLANFKVVFDYRMKSANGLAVPVSADSIYSASAILGRMEDKNGADWAVVKLDRPVVDRKPLRLRTMGKIAGNDPVYVVGCPSGLPMKYAGGAEVRDNMPPAFFVANLDTYGGNSGSPVFSTKSHDVEGILVRGEADYLTSDAGCDVSKICPTTGCRGEDVTRIREIPVAHLQ